MRPTRRSSGILQIPPSFWSRRGLSNAFALSVATVLGVTWVSLRFLWELPGLLIAHFKREGVSEFTPLVLGSLVALVIAGCFKQRADAADIQSLRQLIEEVRLDLKKGEVGKAIDVLKVYEAQGAQRPDGW